MSSVCYSLLFLLVLGYIVNQMLRGTCISSVPLLVFHLVNVMEIVVIISFPLGMVVPVINVDAFSLMMITRLVMMLPHSMLLITFVAMNVMVVVDMSFTPSSVLNTFAISPTMIFPPIINGIKESLLV